MDFTNLPPDSKAFLAPMAGVADRAFREICRDFGAAYTVTEMVSAKGLVMGDRKSRELMTLGSDRPAAIQLFGTEPQVMAQAAKLCLEFEPQAIDINMGCPAPKVANNGAGSALMKDPQLAGEIIYAVAEAVDLPVTVKLRKGWDKAHPNVVELAQIAEQNGAAAVAEPGATPQSLGVVGGMVARLHHGGALAFILNGAVNMAQHDGHTLVNARLRQHPCVC